MNRSEPRPELSRPVAPLRLGKEAKEVFDEKADLLFAMGVMSEVDTEALTRYAELTVIYRRQVAFVSKHGEVSLVREKPGPNGQPGQVAGMKVHPQMGLLLDLSDRLLRMEHEFGLTPAARTRLSAQPIEEPESRGGYFVPMQAPAV